MINLNELMEDEERNDGKCAIEDNILIPAKTKVKAKIIARETKFDVEPGIKETKTGLKYANFGIKILEGKFKNRVFFDSFYIPPKMQSIDLTEGQHKMCARGGYQLADLWNFSHDLRIKSQQSFNTFLDFDGIEFIAEVGQRTWNGNTVNTIERVFQLTKQVEVSQEKKEKKNEEYKPQRIEEEDAQSLLDSFDTEYNF